MSFSEKASDRFGQVFDRSEFQSGDPIVKIQYVQKGNNVVFGRTVKGGDVGNLIYIGKILENTTGKNYLGANAWLDTTFPHVVYITGTRGSGKSFDLGVLVEGISRLSKPSAIQNNVTPLCSIVIDTQSQFWTLKYEPPATLKETADQRRDLQKWNIPANALSNCILWLPAGCSPITGDERALRIRPQDVLHEEWCALIGEDVYSPQGHVLALAIEETSAATANFSLEDLLTTIESSGVLARLPDASRNAVAYKLDGYRRTGLFSPQGVRIQDFLVDGGCSVLLLRDLRNEDKALITGFIARGLFSTMGEFHKRLKVNRFFQRDETKESMPHKVWLVIDEAHVVAPSGSQSAATQALIEYVKRGRDAGLSLVLATQQPSAVDDRILSQVNLTFSHRLSFQTDIAAACNRIPTKQLASLKISGVELSNFPDMVRYLESGQCFLGDHNTSRAVLMQVRPRVTSHGGYSPT
jgi:uncharacterized protein